MNRNKNFLTSQGETVSRTAFGGWAIGGEYWGPQEHKDSVRAIHMALKLGVNHFDTAPVYGKGRSEQLIGQQLKKVREHCLIATKAFYTDPETLQKSFETSLKRLLTDYIDIFYIHWPLSGRDMRPGMEVLEKLRTQGRIRSIGVSNFSLNQIRMVQEAGTVDIYQGGYNILWPRLEEKILPFCRDQNIEFIPYGVLAQGILTERGIEKLQQTHKGFRHKMILYRQEMHAQLLPLLKQIKDVCSRRGWSVENCVTAYTIEQTVSPSVLLGVRNRTQAESNFNLPGGPLPEEIRQVLQNCRLKVNSFIPDAENMFDHKS
ncbi:MAG: hypothetical protein B6241_00450 [Spirochaetaceae bacterium 4572_59]|nr:MAG: hypothetical protein B6241_00450 [Spirochaetaceae bacterium 4572_59]